MPVVQAAPRIHTPGPMPRVHTPGPMPVVQAAEPRIHTPGPMPRVHTPGPIPVAVAPESSPLDVVPAPRHTPVPALPTPVAFAATSDAAAAKLASLASLSIQKEHIEVSAPARSSAKLPWILLVVFVIGGGTYHFITVQNLKAAVATAPAAGSAGSAGSTQPTESPAGVLASGYIAAKDPIMLSATTSGRLNQITVENGAAITKGQVLAVIDDGQIRAELSLAYAHVRDAKRALNRTKTLLKAQAATRLDLERAVGQVEIASAEARVINQKLEDTKIRSPIEGTVLEVIARVGEALNAGPGQGQIMKIADLKALVAEVDVDETEVKNLSLKQPADVILDAARGQFKGNVFEIAEQADRSRGTVLVRVEIEVGDAETVLKPGMAVQVRFLSKPRDAAPKPP
jgi:RND family efflux transporter MFP subunit